jgi:NAD(P)-dependent dehydrogenase (short-subunit alcohol dehydrogenase family)
MTRFDNTAAVVTGGTTGIGFAIARRLIDEGARVLLTGQNAERVREAERALGNAASGLVVDQTSMSDVAALRQAVVEKFGSIDTLVLNAGIAPISGTGNADEDVFNRLFAVNVKAPLFIVQALAPLLKDGGSIVATTSIVDQVALPPLATYAATKAALRSYVRSWAAEFVGRGIRVNSVAPGPITTPLYGKLGLDAQAVEAMGQAVLKNVPMNRFGAPEEVAGVVAFLASGDASYVTGEDVVIAGGWGNV